MRRGQFKTWGGLGRCRDLNVVALRQPKSPSGGISGSGSDCEVWREKQLQRYSGNSPYASTVKHQSSIACQVPPIVHEVLSSLGRPLDPSTCASMEPRFGHDFSRVRLHNGVRAAESARAVSALAYTVGNDIVFAEGQFAPQTALGQRLLAHELTHVIQQSDTHGHESARIQPSRKVGRDSIDAGQASTLPGPAGFPSS